MKQALKNIFAHPKTTLVGLILGASQLAIEAAKAGVHAGHVGNSDAISLAAAIGTLLLGALAKDPQK